MRRSLFYLLVFLCYSVSAQTDLSSAIDALAQSHYESGRFSGAVLVAEKGKILFNKTYSFHDVESTQPLNSKSVFEVASLTKPFTALLTALLQQQSLLNYEDAVSKHLPEFPYPEITIQHLLAHTSGLSEMKFFQWAAQNMQPGKTYHNALVLKYLKTKPDLAFAPGSRWEYSNLGYMTLAALLEKVSGQHYISLLQEQVLEPLDMEQSGIYSQAHKEQNMPEYAFSKVFNTRDSTWIPAFGMAWSDSIYGSVGLISNPTDLLKWDQALYSDQLLTKVSKAEIFSPVALANGQSSGYGLGWFVEEDHQVNGRSVGKVASHYGLWPGYESSIVRFIDQEKTLIIISNMAPSAKDQMLAEITRLLFRY